MPARQIVGFSAQPQRVPPLSHNPGVVATPSRPSTVVTPWHVTSLDARIAGLVADFTPSVDDFEASALGTLVEHFGADAAYFATIGPKFLQRSPEYMQRILAEPQRFDPGFRKSQEIAARFGSAFVDTEAYTPAERDRLSIFRELLRPAGISSVLCAIVNVGPRTTGMLHLVRSGRPFRGDKVAEGRPLLHAVSILHYAIVGRTPSTPEASQAAAERVGRLSSREHEVATLAANGYGALQIAARLGTSVHTVRRQLESIYRKSDVGNRAELATLIHCVQSPMFDGSRASANLVRMLGSVRMHPAVRLPDPTE